MSAREEQPALEQPDMEQPDMEQPALEVRGLRVTRHDGQALVGPLEFSVAAGECVAIVGASGAGKSLTVRALLGLLPAGLVASAERHRIGGRELAQARPRDFRAVLGRRIGLVNQDAMASLDPLRRIRAEITEGAEVHGLVPGHGRAARSRLAESLLARAGFADGGARLRARPHELSGGQRQRALIAAALSADPAVLLADEPTTALDPAARERVLATLAELRGAGRALVLVSHDLGLVSKIADRVLVLDGGRVVEAGETARVLAAPEHAVTRALLAAIPAAPGAGPPGPPPAARPVLSLRGVTLLRGGEPILRDASLELCAGEALGLVGPSGAGKSSLALAALGLLPLAAGDIRLGEDAWSGVQERRRRPLRPRIQWVPQDAMGSFPPGRTVGRILGEALFGTRGDRARGDRAREHAPRARRAARVAELLASVGLDPALASRRPAGLSGGQRQRVAIARALATDPEVLICDESVSALDTISRAAVLDLLARLRREHGLALLFISHDLDVVRSFCDRVLELRDGRLWAGPPRSPSTE